MPSLESIFVREFRTAVKDIGYKDIFKIPLPEEAKSWYVSGTELYLVKDIENADFSDLNGCMVKRLPKNVVAKQRVIDKATKSFKKNEDGSFVYSDYVIPTGSIVVASNKNLSIPLKYWNKAEEGYGYIDFVENSGRILYMYVLPKSALYRLHQTALVLSVKDMKNYAGMGYRTWSDGKIFLHVVPYNPNSKYIASKVLKTACKLNYSKEIKTIVDYWENVGLIPKINLCSLEDGSNLVLKPTTVGYDEYEKVDMLPLSDKEIFGSEVSEEEV